MTDGEQASGLSSDFPRPLRSLSLSSSTVHTWIATRSTIRTATNPHRRRACPPKSGRSHRQTQRILPFPLRRRFPRRRVRATARRAPTLWPSRRCSSSRIRCRRWPRLRRAAWPTRCPHLRHRPPLLGASLRPRRPPGCNRRSRSTRPALAICRRPLPPCRSGPRIRHPQRRPTGLRLLVPVDGAGGWRHVWSVSAWSRRRSFRAAS